jgi:hypothetical protein
MDNLKGEYEKDMKKANDERKERLWGELQELDKVLKKADQGDSSYMWNIVSLTFSFDVLFGMSSRTEVADELPAL